MSVVESFNGLHSKEILHLKDVPHLGHVKIIQAQRTKTMYGECIAVESEDNIIFLPKRYNALSDTELLALGSGAYQLVKESSTDEKCVRIRLEEIPSSV